MVPIYQNFFAISGVIEILFSVCLFSEVEQILIKTNYTKKIPMCIKITSVLL